MHVIIDSYVVVTPTIMFKYSWTLIHVSHLDHVNGVRLVSLSATDIAAFEMASLGSGLDILECGHCHWQPHSVRSVYNHRFPPF